MPRIIKQTNITLASGAVALLSASELTPGEYEVMILSPGSGDEHAVLRSSTEACALLDFEHLRKEYHIPPLSGKYAKLAEDLRQAAVIGYAAAAKSSDGGTCNFDAVCLKLKGWQGAKIKAAAKVAGVGCSEWNLWGSKSWVFPIAAGQADARTDAAEAMRDHLKAQGYEASVYYQMD